MPKLKNLTEADFNLLLKQAEDFLGNIHEVNDRLEKGYCDELEKPLDLVRAFASVTTANARLVSLLLFTNSMQEQRAAVVALRNLTTDH